MEKEEFTIHRIIGNLTPEIKAEIISFWNNEGAINSVEEANQRVNQVLFVARNNQSNIIGICTGFITNMKHLRNNFWYYRSFVGREYRHLNIGKKLLNTTFNYFNREFVEVRNREAIGILIEVESDVLTRYRNQTIWKDMANSVFIGFNQKGHHVRVSYFDGSLISG